MPSLELRRLAKYVCDISILNPVQELSETLVTPVRELTISSLPGNFHVKVAPGDSTYEYKERQWVETCNFHAPQREN